MNLEAKSLTVFSHDNQRYVRDLLCRLLRDEDMLKQFPGETQFHVVVYTEAEFKALAK